MPSTITKAWDWSRGRGNKVIALLLFVGVALLLFRKGLGSGFFVFGTDTYSHDYIMAMYGWQVAKDAMRLPLWCPYFFCGTPFIASFAFCPFYPTQLAFALFDFNTAFTLQYALAYAVGAWSMFVWLRSLRLGFFISLWGGLAFLFSGHFLTLTYAGHLQKAMALAWAPMALAATQFACRSALDLALRRMIGRLLLLAGALALQLTASHSQIFYGTCFACVGWAIAQCPRREKGSWKICGLALAGIAAAAFLAILLSGAQMFCSVEMSRVSNRAAGVPWVEAIDTSYPPFELLEFGVSRVVGDSVRGTDTPYFGAWGQRIVSDYVGIPILLLALLGLAGARKREGCALLAMAALSIVVGLGYYTPLYRVMYLLLPGFKQFRSPGTFMFVATIAIVTLAAYGVRELAAGPTLRGLFGRKEKLVLIVIPAVALALGCVALVWALWRNHGVRVSIATAEEMRRYLFWARIRNAGICMGLSACAIWLIGELRCRLPEYAKRIGLCGAAVFAIAALAFPIAKNLRYVTFDPLGPYLDYLWHQPVYPVLKASNDAPVRLLEERSLKLENILHHVGSPTGYHPVMLRRYEMMMGAIGYSSDAFTGMFAVNYAHTYDNKPPGEQTVMPFTGSIPTFRAQDRDRKNSWELLRALDGGQSLWKRINPPSPYVRSHETVLPSDNPRKVTSSGTSVIDPNLLTRFHLQGGEQPCYGRLLSWRDDTIRLSTYADKPSILPVAEVFAPGWKASTETGERITILPVNYAQRALVVPKGAQAITMTYDPFSFRLGLFATLLSLGGIITWFAAGWVRRLLDRF